MNEEEYEEPDVVYFSMNNWQPEVDYPPVQPYIDWVGGDFGLKFRDEEFAIQNRLCIKVCIVDMSQNFLVTSLRSWVEENCPDLLTTYKKFVYDPEDDGCPPQDRFGYSFLYYCGDNIGLHYYDEDDECVDDNDYDEEED